MLVGGEPVSPRIDPTVGPSTASKQPAIGVAGTPAPDVASVQGAPGMTPIAVTANAGTNLNTSALALDASITALKNALQPYQGAVLMTVDTVYAAARALLIDCTVAGTVAVTMADGSALIVAVVVGTVTFPISVTKVKSVGTTATATYYNLS